MTTASAVFPIFPVDGSFLDPLPRKSPRAATPWPGLLSEIKTMGAFAVSISLAILISHNAPSVCQWTFAISSASADIPLWWNGVQGGHWVSGSMDMNRSCALAKNKTKQKSKFETELATSAKLSASQETRQEGTTPRNMHWPEACSRTYSVQMLSVTWVSPSALGEAKTREQ